MKLMGVLAGILLYMEVVYHVGCFGFAAGNPVFTLVLILVVASWQALIISCVRKKWKKRVFWAFLGVEYLLFAVQLIYMRIFKQPLLLDAIINAGGDALTNYWRETIAGILDGLPLLMLLLIPLVLAGVFYTARGKKLPGAVYVVNLRLMLSIGVGIVLATAVMLIGKYIEADYYEDYSEFYDPLTVAESMGVIPMVQRDISGSLGKWTGQLLALEKAQQNGESDAAGGHGSSGEAGTAGGPDAIGESDAAGSQAATGESGAAGSQDATGESGKTGENSGMEMNDSKESVTQHRLPIDFESLKAAADGKEITWLAEYMSALIPTDTNEYTGIFEGYNLIYLTAEGFSPYAVSEELTPTLYRLIHSGFDFTNYYVPLWQTSTSDGEYINCTGLIPDGQFSMRKSGSNRMLFTLPRFFASEGVDSMAYHNNSLSYYDRHVTHNNLGYVFKASKLGDLSENDWGEYVFSTANPNAWPASDLEMMEGTVNEYINRDRFHVYYLTVSGHMNYSFKGNAMAYKNREAVSELTLSETARAYIACQIELDKALEYLIGRLEAADKLENTVICLSSDHYPYGMKQEVYEELAGRTLSDNMELYRNNLILWNVRLEKKPLVIDKVCGPMDIVPTLLNLFGFTYDSRLYAGRDIFSDEEGMVIFNDRSFVTDSVIYNRKTKQAWWKLDHGEDARSYLEQKQQEAKDRYQFSAYILRNDYYGKIAEALPQE